MLKSEINNTNASNVMSDVSLLNKIKGVQSTSMLSWAMSLRLMLMRKSANKGKTLRSKSRGEVRDMRCDLAGIFAEVMILLHLMNGGGSVASITHIQENLFHKDINARPNGEADILAYDDANETVWIDAKSYSIMRPYQTNTIKVNVEKNHKLVKAGCEHLIFCAARPFSSICIFTGLVPIEDIPKLQGCQHVQRDHSHNDYYSIPPASLLKYGAEMTRALYYEPQHNIEEVERIALKSSRFDHFIKRKFPKIDW